jgi:hypothetical protein
MLQGAACRACREGAGASTPSRATLQVSGAWNESGLMAWRGVSLGCDRGRRGGLDRTGPGGVVVARRVAVDPSRIDG